MRLLLVRRAIFVTAMIPAGWRTLEAQLALRVGVPQDVPTMVAVRANLDTASLSLSCTPLDDREITISHGSAEAVNGRYKFRRVVAEYGSYVPSGDVTIDCRVENQSGDSLGAVKFSVRSPSPSSFVPRFAGPDTLIVGETFNPIVSVFKRDEPGRLKPVQGVTVKIQLPLAQMWTSGTTDASGRAAFETIPTKGTIPGSRGSIFVRIGSRSEDFKSQVEILPGKPRKITLTDSFTTRRVGDPFDIHARVEDESGNDACRAGEVIVRLIGARGSLVHGDSAKAEQALGCDHGEASIRSIRYLGRVDTVALMINAGSASHKQTFTAVLGEPAHLRIMQQPPGFVVADSFKPMSPGALLRVEDAAGNHVPNATLAVRIARCDTLASPECNKSELFGRLMVQTDSMGLARFDSVVFFGKEGNYQLCFESPGRSAGGIGTPCVDSPAILSRSTRLVHYDIDREFNRSFVIVSAVHSVAGNQKPANEFFDLRFRFKLPHGFGALVYADLALQRKTTSDTTVKSTQRDLSDAHAMLNWTCPARWKCGELMRMKDAQTDALDRLLFVGGQLRVFAGVPYTGVQVGSIEMRHSIFFGSSLAVGLIWPLSYMPAKGEDNSVIYPSGTNYVVDAFLRSSGLDFLKFLNVRATILFPREKGRTVLSRLAVAVPVGGITQF